MYYLLFVLLHVFAGNSLETDHIYDYGDEIDARITGGEDGDIADYPYMLALSYSSKIYCSASLISPTWALTTAVCTDRVTADHITVLANSSTWNTSLEVNVSRIVQNPSYDIVTFEHDISLLQLVSPLECLHCRPIPLAQSVPFLGQTGTLTGWGWLVQLGNFTEVLQVLEDIPIADHAECRATYHLKKDVTEEMFCAGFFITNVTRDFCQGDLGSPLVVDGALAGLASWGYGCSDSIYPGVYTAVASYSDWIYEYVDDIDSDQTD